MEAQDAPAEIQADPVPTGKREGTNVSLGLGELSLSGSTGQPVGLRGGPANDD